MYTALDQAIIDCTITLHQLNNKVQKAVNNAINAQGALELYISADDKAYGRTRVNEAKEALRIQIDRYEETRRAYITLLTKPGDREETKNYTEQEYVSAYEVVEQAYSKRG